MPFRILHGTDDPKDPVTPLLPGDVVEDDRFPLEIRLRLLDLGAIEEIDPPVPTLAPTSPAEGGQGGEGGEVTEPKEIDLTVYTKGELLIFAGHLGLDEKPLGKATKAVVLGTIIAHLNALSPEDRAAALATLEAEADPEPAGDETGEGS